MSCGKNDAGHPLKQFGVTHVHIHRDPSSAEEQQRKEGTHMMMKKQAREQRMKWITSPDM